MYKAILYIGIEVSKKYVEDKNVAYILHKIVSNNNRIAIGISAMKIDFINLVLNIDITIPWQD